MAGMFYTLQEAAEKLNMTEEEIKQIIEEGKLRGFRDGPSFFLKIDEVETYANQEGASIVPEEPQSKEPAEVLESEPESEPSFEGEPTPEPVEKELPQPEEQEILSPEFKEEEKEMPEIDETESQVPAEDFDMESMEELVQEIPAVEDVAAEEIPAVRPTKAEKKAARKAARQQRPKAGPKVKPVAITQRLSFGQWLLFSLKEDNPAGIFVLALIFCLVLAIIAALGYGLHFLYVNF